MQVSTVIHRLGEVEAAITDIEGMNKPVRIHNLMTTQSAVLMQPGFDTYWEIPPHQSFDITKEFPPRLKIAGLVRVEVLP